MSGVAQPADDPTQAEAWRSVADAVNGRLSDWLNQQSQIPEVLQKAMAHGVLLGGKRLRPVLCVWAAEMVGGAAAAEKALVSACALEMIHAYSLIHDDLPSMDDDTLRRGQPTVHVEYGEVTAILAGDALNTEAFGMMAESNLSPEAIVASVGVLARAAGAAGMVGGQYLDMCEGPQSVEELQRLSGLKTGALIAAACELGAIAGGAEVAERRALVEYGLGIGLAFQMIDDVLDVSGSAQELGKAVAKDQAAGKRTFPAFLGVSGARDQAKKARDRAIGALEPFGERAKPLVKVAEFVVSRTH